MNIHSSNNSPSQRDDVSKGNKIKPGKKIDTYYDEFVLLAGDSDRSNIVSNINSTADANQEETSYLSKSLPELSTISVSETDIISNTSSSNYLKDDNNDSSFVTTFQPGIQAYGGFEPGYTRCNTSPLIKTNNSIPIRSSILKNKPIVLAAKSRMSEITQTTAKVSIGNTTISVPLLKPVSSAQIIQASVDQKTQLKTLGIDSQVGDQQKHLVTQSNNKHTRILNVNCPQKLNPTIVSLSHFKIKPSSNAKIVQATVMSKKLQLPNVVDANDKVHLTKVSSNADQVVKIEQLSQTENPINWNEQMTDSLQEHGSEDNLSKSNSSNLNNKHNIQNIYQGNSNINKQSAKCNSIEYPTESKTDVQTKSEIRELLGSSTVKNILTSVTLPTQSISPISKGTELNTILKKVKCSASTSNKVYEVVPHFLSKSLAGSTLTTRSPGSTTASETTNQRIPASTVLNTSPSKKASFLSVPRTISLMLSKSSTSQPTKIPINLETSTEKSVDQNGVDPTSKKITFPKMITLKKSPVVGSLEDLQKPFHIIPLNSSISQVSGLQSSCLKGQQIQKFEINASKKIFHAIDAKSIDGEIRTSTTSESTFKRICVDTDTSQSSLLKGNENCKSGGMLPMSVSAKNITPNTTQESNINISQSKSNVALSKSQELSPSKVEDSQNILLKQLLKNTSSNTVPITTSISSVCSQALSNRKIINVRAPSLGLVSSLEAQLARPVIPPVTETTSNVHASNSAQPEKKRKSKNETEALELESEVNNKFPDSTKQSFQKISKETSFVSNPKFLSSNNAPKVAAKISTSNNPVLNMNASLPDVSVSMYENSHALSVNSVSTDASKTHARGIIENKRDIEQSIANKNKFPVLSSLGCNPSQQHEIKTCTAQININNLLVQQNKSIDNNDLKETLSNSASLKTNEVDQNFLPPEIIRNESLIKKKRKESDLNAEKINKECLHPQKKLKSCVISDNGTFESLVPSNNVTSVKSSKLANCTNNSNPLITSLTSASCTQKIQGRNSIVPKGIEKRRKRKREFYKQRRHYPNSNKESLNITEINSSKKKSRKAFKNEEDYDIFMDKTLLKLKQMPPLQVLEPLLCRNVTMLNSEYLNKSINNREQANSSFNKVLQQLGSQYPMDINFYEMHPYGGVMESSKAQNKLNMQNDFYDQEFSLDVSDIKRRKLSNLISGLRDKTLEISENNFPTNISQLCFPKWDSFFKMPFPGIAVINHDMESMGRISPIISRVDSTQLHVKPLPIMKKLQKTSSNDPYIRKYMSDYDDEKKLTVILTVPSSKAINVLSILKKLANLLHTSTVSSYKFLDSVSTYQKNVFKLKKANEYKKIQNALNGTMKFCAQCKMTITKTGIRTVCKNKNSQTYGIQTTIKDFKYNYLCSRLCYDEFKCKNDYIIDRFMKDSNMNRKLIECNGNSQLRKSRKCRFKYHKRSLSETNHCLGDDVKRFGKNLSFKLSSNMSNFDVRGFGEDGVILEKSVTDTRRCILCNQTRDGISNGTSRLLNYDVDLWVHLNCALWSNGVYETISGGLMNVEIALQSGVSQTCSFCQHLGATIKCFKNRCNNTFHLICAKKEQCVFYKNKTVHCQAHASKSGKDNELISISALRRIFVERDENRQVAAIMHHSDLNNLLRVGSLVFLNVGQILPHQLEAFHTAHYIYPIGYKTIRFYWSMNTPGARCRYICTIAEVAGRPEFRVQVQDQNVEIKGVSPNAVWHRILEPIVAMRKQYQCTRIFPKFVSGDELFGLNEPAIVRVLESLPGVETLTDYCFKYGRNPLLELPLAIHPTGSARTEPKQRQVLGLKKPHTQRTSAATNQRLSNSMVVGEIACPYSKQFVHSKSSQYKKMKQEWRNNVYLARSKIQGLGLYAARDVEKHTMVIEYIGEVIRTEVSEIREKHYESKNRGIYMFRLDEDRIVDATLSGGLARYINHSCNPNCVTEIVDVDRELRIIIFAKRRINRGEELSYDYKFDIEDDSNKLSCMCGAPNCRKWMN